MQSIHRPIHVQYTPNTGLTLFFTITRDGVSCDDVDECADAKRGDTTDLCEHVCVNEIGSYKCACRSGYRLVGGVSCLPDSSFLSKQNGMGPGEALFVTFTVLLAVSVGAYVGYKFVLKQRIDGEVRQIMRTYMPLEDHEGSPGATPNFGLGRSSRGNGNDRDAEFGGTKLEDMRGGSVVR
jgi:hypothetical protein